MRRLAHIHKKTQTPPEPLWHVQAALFLVIILQFVLDSALTVAPRLIIAGVEVLLLFALMILTQIDVKETLRRTISILLLALITIGNILSLVLVADSLFSDTVLDGKNLLISAFSIFITNILVFGLWYWEMDYRRSDKPLHFLFAQEGAPDSRKLNDGWEPTFFDYVYISVVNATSFSPTDTLPLTHQAKLLMTLQSIISLIIVVLVTARAVSILG
jgi:uncharacterized membrane protein